MGNNINLHVQNQTQSHTIDTKRCHLSMYYQNVRGLNTKLIDLFNATSNCDFDILCFTETWLSPHIFDSELCCDKYTVFRCDRRFEEINLSRGGRCNDCS